MKHATELVYRTVDSPLGRLRLGADDAGLVELAFEGGVATAHAESAPRSATTIAPAATILDLATRELEAYFAGRLERFTTPLAPRGTDFQRAVWSALAAIPFGERRAYRDIARALGRAGAERAVGAANGQNRIAIAIPCHRVVGANGDLTGYAGGLERKRWLLTHEARVVAATRFSLDTEAHWK